MKVLAFGDPDDTAALVDKFKGTHRAKGRTESREKQVQALRVQAKAEGGTIYHVESGTKEDWDVSGIQEGSEYASADESLDL